MQKKHFYDIFALEVFLLNERMKEIRIYLNLSQEEFGNKIGIKSRGHISALESGTKKITDRIFIDICREYNVNEDWLRYGIGDMFIQKADEDIEALGKKYNFDSATIALIKTLKESNEFERKIFFDVLIKCVNAIGIEIEKEK